MSDTTLAPPRKSSAVDRRLLITFSVMLATIMQALDTTIANVALPHMQGAMGATRIKPRGCSPPISSPQPSPCR